MPWTPSKLNSPCSAVGRMVDLEPIVINCQACDARRIARLVVTRNELLAAERLDRRVGCVGA